MDKLNLGLIGIVNNEAKDDFRGTMTKVARIGYRGIEGGDQLLQGDVAGNLRWFHDLGLQVLTVGASVEQLATDVSSVIAKAKALQSRRATVWWSLCDSRDAILRDAEIYNTAGKSLADEGITLCYHNHDQEFRNVIDGVYALDVLALNTDPNALAFELDIAWIAFGGEDPVKVLRRLAGRVPAIHIKDVYGLRTRGEWTAVGTGVVDVAAAVECAIDLGIEWGVVEQDQLRNLTPLETITVSYLNLKERGLVH